MAQKKRRAGTSRTDVGNPKMGPEELQEHLKLKTRARRIPDKKKLNDRRACRNTRRALPASAVVLLCRHQRRRYSPRMLTLEGSDPSMSSSDASERAATAHHMAVTSRSSAATESTARRSSTVTA